MASSKQAAFLIPCGLIFLGVGAGFGFFSVRTLLRAETMRAWRETPATVLACSLDISRGSKGGSTYRVSASYRYEADGRSHIGERVTLHSGSDNIGRFHQRVHATLDACKRNNQPTTCWVNPADPTEAILIRTIRPELVVFFHLFVLAFGGVGLGIVVYGLTLLTPRKVTRDGLIAMRDPYAHCGLVAVAVVLNGYIGWTLWMEWRVLSPDLLPWYAWLPAAAGLLLAIIAGHRWARFRRFGVSVLALSSATVVTGGPLSGTLRIPAKRPFNADVELKLTCVRQYTTGSGKHRSTNRDVLWQDETCAPTHASGAFETPVPVRFALPADQPATTANGGCDGVYWQLTASASMTGVDYKAVFDIPVRQTKSSVDPLPS
ncbi:MAG: DUF3592 domain-containing protein [Lentisphaerae bacterium]|nr:DUF3592 domain-containing protein [Lentisphaerota bacterium]